MPVDPSRAVVLLRQRLNELEALTTSNADFKDWRERTEATIRAVMPADDPTLSKFVSVRTTPMALVGGSDNSAAYARAFQRGKESFAAILKAAIFDRELAIDPDAEGPFLSLAVMPRIEVVVSEFHKASEEGELDTLDRDDRVEAETLVDALNSQTRSPRPNRGVIRWALQRLDQIVVAGIGAAAGAGLVEAIHAATAVVH